MNDFERTLIDRIYTNLDHNFVHLPKRAIARLTNTMLGQAILVLPKEDVDVAIEATLEGHKEWIVDKGESPYGKPSDRSSQGGSPVAQSPVIQSSNQVNSKLSSVKTDSVEERKTASVEELMGNSSAWDMGAKEKMLALIVFLVVISYVYFNFLR